jgi:hypothetical protein
MCNPLHPFLLFLLYLRTGCTWPLSAAPDHAAISTHFYCFEFFAASGDVAGSLGQQPTGNFEPMITGNICAVFILYSRRPASAVPAFVTTTCLSTIEDAPQIYEHRAMVALIEYCPFALLACCFSKFEFVRWQLGIRAAARSCSAATSPLLLHLQLPSSSRL